MLTDREIVDAMQADTPRARARAAFSAACGKIGQAEQQRRKPSIIEIRRMEFEAVDRIIAAYQGNTP